MKKFIILAAIMVCGCSVWAAEAQMFKLDNGQTVVIQEVRNNPIVIIDTWIKTGSIDEDDTNNGVAHFLEHKVFEQKEGDVRYDGDVSPPNRRLRRRGASRFVVVLSNRRLATRRGVRSALGRRRLARRAFYCSFFEDGTLR